MMRKTIELARVGVHGLAGQPVTERDLKEIVETFGGTAPITIGHELADWMPAFGKVVGVRYNGKTQTLAGVVELSDLLAEAWEQGLYSAWSIGAPRRAPDGKRVLHHLAFLGAVPPAVKGLKTLETVNLSEIVPQDSIVSPPQEETMKLEDLQTQLEAERTARQAAEKRATEAEAKLASGDRKELSDLESENARLKGRLAEVKKRGLLQAAAGKLPKAREQDLVALAEAVNAGPETIELADAEGKKESLSPIDLLIRIFSAINKPLADGALELGDGGGEPGGSSPFEGLSKYV